MITLRRKLATSPLLSRLPWTLLILFIYLLGRSLPLATVPVLVDGLPVSDSLLENLAMVSGGNFASLTLFSLGLSPFMTGMILWRFLTFFNYFKIMTTERAHRGRMTLMFAIALLQALGLTRATTFVNVPLFGLYEPERLRWLTVGILIAGAYVLMWLGNMNALKGIGASMIIIITNMLLSFFSNFTSFLGSREWTGTALTWSLLGLVLALGILVLITVTVYRAEYRIKIRRITIISAFAEETYLPIKLNPAGGMPFMYSMTLMILPPMLISALLTVFPESDLLLDLSGRVGLTQLPGIMIYIGLLVVLSIGFAYYNYDPTQLAENMQNNGDYIEHIRPGQETAAYINRYLNTIIVIGTIFVVVMAGGPLLLRWYQGGEVGLALLVNNIYIVTTLMLTVIEQVNTLQSWKKYDKLI